MKILEFDEGTPDQLRRKTKGVILTLSASQTSGDIFVDFITTWASTDTCKY